MKHKVVITTIMCFLLAACSDTQPTKGHPNNLVVIPAYRGMTDLEYREATNEVRHLDEMAK